jgi:hypothetical protein
MAADETTKSASVETSRILNNFMRSSLLFAWKLFAFIGKKYAFIYKEDE